MNMKKIVATAAALSLTAAVAVGGTLAWLTDTTTAEENTFTYKFGVEDKPITIELTDVFPEKEMYPGAELNKDVSVTVKANSMNCYVYLEVQNGFFETEGVDLVLDTTKWTAVSGAGTANTIYRYNSIVSNSTSDQPLDKLLDKVTFDQDMDHATLTRLDQTKITVQAYAIQADGADMTEEVANAAAIEWLTAN